MYPRPTRVQEVLRPHYSLSSSFGSAHNKQSAGVDYSRQMSRPAYQTSFVWFNAVEVWFRSREKFAPVTSVSTIGVSDGVSFPSQNITRVREIPREVPSGFPFLYVGNELVAIAQVTAAQCILLVCLILQITVVGALAPVLARS